jgi:hypothetical protein
MKLDTSFFLNALPMPAPESGLNGAGAYTTDTAQKAPILAQTAMPSRKIAHVCEDFFGLTAQVIRRR